MRFARGTERGFAVTKSGIFNLGKNKLHALPDSFAKDLPNLKILFCLANEFRKVPEVLGEMEHLFMLSFKANKVREIPEQSLPIASLGWLILSDNEIEVLPKSLGKCRKMRKLMLAGNKIKELPTFMSELVNLELLRASDNRIEVFPEFLYRLPKLAWLAFAANRARKKRRRTRWREVHERSNASLILRI